MRSKWALVLCIKEKREGEPKAVGKLGRWGAEEGGCYPAAYRVSRNHGIPSHSREPEVTRMMMMTMMKVMMMMMTMMKVMMMMMTKAAGRVARPNASAQPPPP